MARKLKAGKLPPDLLKKWLSRVNIKDDRVVIGPRYGEDAAVIDFGDSYLVAKTDPVTFTADRLGWYTVHINANDVAVMGARPKWFLGTLLLPEGRADENLVESIFQDLLKACDEANVSLCGGHTEVTKGINQPILVGQMLGEVEKRKLRSLADARPGDRVLLTRGIAIEGTAIIAVERAEEVRQKLGEKFHKRAAGFLNIPGISVMNAALTAADIEGVVAMHDPTEGGLAAGLAKTASVAGTGLRIERKFIKIYPETQKLCEMYNLNPMGLIASGALIIVVRPDSAQKVISAMDEKSVECADIGELTSGDDMKLIDADTEYPLEFSSTDEITRLP